MSTNKDSNSNLTAIRGATTSDGDEEKYIKSAVIELIKEFISLNAVSYTHLTLPTSHLV